MYPSRTWNPWQVQALSRIWNNGRERRLMLLYLSQCLSDDAPQSTWKYIRYRFPSQMGVYITCIRPYTILCGCVQACIISCNLHSSPGGRHHQSCAFHIRQPLLKATHGWEAQEAEPGPSDLKLMPFYHQPHILSTVKRPPPLTGVPRGLCCVVLLMTGLTRTPEMNFGGYSGTWRPVI